MLRIPRKRTFYASPIAWVFCAIIVFPGDRALADDANTLARPGQFIVSLPSDQAALVISQIETANANSAAAQLAAKSGAAIESLGSNLFFVRSGFASGVTPNPELAGNNITPGGLDATTLKNALAEQLGLAPTQIAVTPDYVGVLAVEPNDADYIAVQRQYLSLIHMPEAWDHETDTVNIVVAVLDSGIMYNHEDLKDNMWHDPANNSVGYDFYDNQPDPQAKFLYMNRKMNSATGRCEPAPGALLREYEQHGTRVASIIGAVGNNNRGIAGVAWRTKIMAIRVAEDGPACTAVDLGAAIRGIRFAVDHGAKVINASWYGFPDNDPLRQAIQYANDKGVVFVTAAGNDSKDRSDAPTYPQNYQLPNIVVVASEGPDRAISKFSAFGSAVVDIAAPGEGIEGAVPRPFSPQLTSSYGTDDGTSFSSPIVAGVAALLLARDPNMTPVSIKERIVESADHLPNWINKVRAGGVLNAEAALSMTPQPMRAAASLTAMKNMSFAEFADLEKKLAVLPPDARAKAEELRQLLPNRGQISVQQYNDLIQGLSEQLTELSLTYVPVTEGWKKIIVETYPWANQDEIKKRLSVITEVKPISIDAQTYEVKVKSAQDMDLVIKSLQDNTGIKKAYVSPTGTLQ